MSNNESLPVEPAPKPKTVNRFVLLIPGVDSFLVKEVHLPAFRRKEQHRHENTVKCDEHITVVFHAIQEIQIEQQLAQLLWNDAELDVTLKQFSDEGMVLLTMSFKARLDHFRHSGFTYESTDSSVVYAEFMCSQCTFI